MQVECPECSATYEVVPELAGKVAKCRACGGKIPIPELRTKPDQVEQPSKPTPPKPTVAKPAPAKPKASEPAKTPVKRKRDVEFDDVEVVDDFEDDELEVLEEDEPIARAYSAPAKSRGKKPSKKKTSRSRPDLNLSWLSSIGGFLNQDITGLTLILLGIGLFILLANVLPNRGNMSREMQLVFCAGVSFAFVGNFWMLFRMWKISSMWGGLFLASAALIRGLGRVVPEEVVFGLEILRFLVLLAFVIDNWDEFKVPVSFSVLGLCLLTPAMLGWNQGGGQPIADAAAPAAGQNNGVIRPDRVNPAGAAAGPVVVVPFPVADVPIPELPEFSLGPGGNGETFPDRAVTCMRQFFINGKGNSARSVNLPGANGVMIYYEPKGIHAPRSLPCVLVASAGTNLLEGNDCPTKEYTVETLPYVKAGFAVLGFSLDGYSPKELRMSEEQRLKVHFTQFQKAHAGLVNVRNAVEFASQKIPQVDPERLFIAGHSSAATLALLAASHEPRLKGAVAYAPATDVETRLSDLLKAPGVDQELPGVLCFAKQSSPLSHVSRIACPVFLFHAADDSNVPISESRRFAELLKTNGKAVDYVEVQNGNHYDSMIQQGIPRAIAWLKSLAAKNETIPETPPAVAEKSKPQSLPDTPAESVANVVASQQVKPKAPFVNDTPKLDPPKVNAVPKNATAAAAEKPNESKKTRRIVKFRYERFSGKGSSEKSVREALKRFDWANQEDIVLDSKNHEIRIGLLAESPDFEPARKALSNAGFVLAAGVTTATVKD